MENVDSAAFRALGFGWQ